MGVYRERMDRFRRDRLERNLPAAYQAGSNRYYAIGDLIQAVLETKDPDEMVEFYEEYVADLVASGVDDPTGKARADIGWAFGEGMDPEIRRLWVWTVGAERIRSSGRWRWN